MGIEGYVGLWPLSCCFDLGLFETVAVGDGIKGLAVSSSAWGGRRLGAVVRISISSLVGLFRIKLRSLRRQRRMKYIATAARPACRE